MKRILTTLSEKWPEYLLEILVLIIGIYGAFALDQWNEDRKSQNAQKALLGNFREEFQANLSQLDTVLAYDRLAAGSSIYLMDLIKTKKQLSEDHYDSVFLNVHQLWSFDPYMGVLRSAISSGDIQLIKSKELLNHLFSWEDLVKDAQENEIRFIKHHMETSPQFFDKIQLANSYKLYDNRIPKSYYSSDYEALLNDPKFENFLAAKILWVYDAEKELLLVRDKALKILELISQE